MSKSKSKRGTFGSRKGVGTATLIRNKTAKLSATTEDWFNEASRITRITASMPAAATIVTAYHREYSDRLNEEERVVLQQNMDSLVQVVGNHIKAVDEVTKDLINLRDTYASKPVYKKQDELKIAVDFMNIASRNEEIMNDFASVGMTVIDNCLDTFRELAKRDEEVPKPKYMNPTTPEQEAYANDAPEGVQVTVIDSIETAEAIKEKNETENVH